GVLLDDLVGDPAQRALQIGLVEEHPACDLGNAHPAGGSVVGQAHVILRLLPGLSGRGLKGHAGLALSSIEPGTAYQPGRMAARRARAVTVTNGIVKWSSSPRPGWRGANSRTASSVSARWSGGMVASLLVDLAQATRRSASKGVGLGKSRRSTGPNRSCSPTLSQSDPSTCDSTCAPITSVPVSSATQPIESSRMFQSRPNTPPGRSTRAISSSAASLSNQWKAWPTSTASTLSSSSGICSAAPACTGTSG